MAVPDTVTVNHYRGDTLGMLIRLWEDEEKTDPVDLTGVVVSAQVRQTPNSLTILATFVTSVIGNEIHLLLPPAQSAKLPPLILAFDVQVDWTGDGSMIQTIVRGPLNVAADVTRVGA